MLWPALVRYAVGAAASTPVVDAAAITGTGCCGDHRPVQAAVAAGAAAVGVAAAAADTAAAAKAAAAVAEPAAVAAEASAARYL
jgi:hypothetical protein